MITTSILEKITAELGAEVIAHQPVSGGDINEAHQLQSADGQSLFLKLNDSALAGQMLRTEAAGLEMLSRFWKNTPKVITQGEVDQTAFLVLEYISPSPPTSDFWESFGHQLARLHQTFSDEFGLDHDNFIGSIPQSNHYAYEWSEFYFNSRLAPQIHLAIEKGLLTESDLDQAQQLESLLGELCPDEPPALTHGDLWSGNFLCNKDQQAILIDPAISFAHREMDLAMSRLFGGFDPAFYSAYEEAYPLAPGFHERMEIYQLYYLLAHVNLFGYSYVASVRRILDKYVGS